MWVQASAALPMIEDNIREMIAKGPRRISPFFVPGSIVNMVAGMISIHFGIKGPNVSMVSACTTSTHCIGDAARFIEYGDADVMIAGGSEATVCLSGIGGFCSVKALSERNDSPETASRPWDKDRDGFVLGRGRRHSGVGIAGARQGARCAHLRRTGRPRHER